MRVLGTLLVVGAVLAVLRLAVMAFALALLLLLTWGFLTRPGPTVACIAALTFLALADSHPLACIIGAAVVGVAVVTANHWRKGGRPLLLTNRRERS